MQFHLEKVQKYLVNENFNLYVGVITSILLVISNNSVFYTIYIYIYSESTGGRVWGCGPFV